MSGKTARRGRQASTAASRPAAQDSAGDGGDRPVTMLDLAPPAVRRGYSDAQILEVLKTRSEWARIERQVDHRRRLLVQDARGRGLSWDGVGWLLGTTGEAARKRYS